MSSIVLRKKIDPVEFDTEDIGSAFMRSDAGSQREMLIAMANAVDGMLREGGSWVMQCNYICTESVDRGGLTDYDKARIAAMLTCLLEHLQ